MATYAEIIAYVRENCGYKPKSCWIAHTKEICGLRPKMASNRRNPDRRVCPCPANKLEDIKAAFAHFGMIEKEHAPTHRRKGKNSAE